MKDEKLEKLRSELEEIKKAPPSIYWAARKRIIENIGVCSQFLAACEKSCNQELRSLDFGVPLYTAEIMRVIKDLKRFGISGFTISASSDVIRMIKDFVDLGCEIVGVETIKKPRGDVPAIRMHVKGTDYELQNNC